MTGVLSHVGTWSPVTRALRVVDRPRELKIGTTIRRLGDVYGHPYAITAVELIGQFAQAHRSSFSLGSVEEDWREFTKGLSDLTAEDDSALQAALSDLNDVNEEATEEGYPEPSASAIENAGKILRAIYPSHPRRFEVYPTVDGEVAIDARSPEARRSVLILCASDGGALCLVNLDGKHRRAVYDSAATLPDGFTREALADVYD